MLLWDPAVIGLPSLGTGAVLLPFGVIAYGIVAGILGIARRDGRMLSSARMAGYAALVALTRINPGSPNARHRRISESHTGRLNQKPRKIASPKAATMPLRATVFTSATIVAR